MHTHTHTHTQNMHTCAYTHTHTHTHTTPHQSRHTIQGCDPIWFKKEQMFVNMNQPSCRLTHYHSNKKSYYHCINKTLLYHIYIYIYSQESSVDIATRYGLDGLGIESRWGGEIFHITPDQPWGPSSLLHKWVLSLSQVKAARVQH
jgi:hypothetical protein